MVGGGTGERFGSAKQYERIGDARIIDMARAAAEACSDGVVLVVPAADVEREHGVAGGDDPKRQRAQRVGGRAR